MSSEEKHNELSEEFDELTARLKEMSSDNPEYPTLWDKRAEIRREMDRLSKEITG